MFIRISECQSRRVMAKKINWQVLENAALMDETVIKVQYLSTVYFDYKTICSDEVSDPSVCTELLRSDEVLETI